MMATWMLDEEPSAYHYANLHALKGVVQSSHGSEEEGILRCERKCSILSPAPKQAQNPSSSKCENALRGRLFISYV